MSTDKAIKFLTIDDDGKLKVHADSTNALNKEVGPVNMITITGIVGTGKSTLAGLLTDKSKCFKISDALDSVTKGADICKPQNGPTAGAPKLCICDVEGQADGLGIGWEAKLSAPLVLTSKVLIVNVMCNTGRLSVVSIDRLRNVLHVVHMVHPDKKRENMLGHLHVVLRDCPSNMSVEDATRKLLAKEDVEKCKGGPMCRPQAIARNELRSDIARYFASATVWCLPKPCPDPTAFNGLVAGASPEFQAQLTALKKCLSTHLTSPMCFGAEALTGPMLSQVVTEVAECLNGAPKDSDLSALLNPVTLLESIRERKRLAEEARLAEERARLAREQERLAKEQARLAEAKRKEQERIAKEEARIAEERRVYEASVIQTTEESRTVEYNCTTVPIMRTENRTKKKKKWHRMSKKTVHYQVQVHAGNTVTKFMRLEKRLVKTLGSGQIVNENWTKVREWTEVQQTA